MRSWMNGAVVALIFLMIVFVNVLVLRLVPCMNNR